MSTKIYIAYRTKRGVDKWQLLWKIRQKAQENVIEKLKKMYIALMESPDALGHICKEQNIQSIDCMTPLEIGAWFYEQYKKQCGDTQRNPFDFDASFTVRNRGGRFYIIPYCGDGVCGIFDFLNEMDELEGYGYWNNTDRPEGISEQAWAGRRKIWNYFLDRWDDCVAVDVSNVYGFYKIDARIILSEELKEAWEKAKKKMKGGK